MTGPVEGRVGRGVGDCHRLRPQDVGGVVSRSVVGPVTAPVAGDDVPDAPVLPRPRIETQATTSVSAPHPLGARVVDTPGPEVGGEGPLAEGLVLGPGRREERHPGVAPGAVSVQAVGPGRPVGAPPGREVGGTRQTGPPAVFPPTPLGPESGTGVVTAPRQSPAAPGDAGGDVVGPLGTEGGPAPAGTGPQVGRRVLRHGAHGVPRGLLRPRQVGQRVGDTPNGVGGVRGRRHEVPSDGPAQGPGAPTALPQTPEGPRPGVAEGGAGEEGRTPSPTETSPRTGRRLAVLLGVTAPGEVDGLVGGPPGHAVPRRPAPVEALQTRPPAEPTPVEGRFLPLVLRWDCEPVWATEGPGLSCLYWCRDDLRPGQVSTGPLPTVGCNDRKPQFSSSLGSDGT